MTLTKREQEVKCLLLNGYSPKEITKKLNISKHTTRSHINHICDKEDSIGMPGIMGILTNELNRLKIFAIHNANVRAGNLDFPEEDLTDIVLADLGINKGETNGQQETVQGS